MELGRRTVVPEKVAPRAFAVFAVELHVCYGAIGGIGPYFDTVGTQLVASGARILSFGHHSPYISDLIEWRLVHRMLKPYIMRDLRLAYRRLVRRPGITALAILSLAVSIGLGTAAFSILDALIFRDLPLRDPAQLISIGTRDLQGKFQNLTWRQYGLIANRTHAFSAVAAEERMGPTVHLPDRDDFPITAGVSDNYFDMLGIPAGRGDLFHGGADQEGVVVLSDRYWRRTLRADPQIIGRVLNVGRSQVRVIGVLPPNNAGPHRGLVVDLYVPPATFFRTLGIGSPGQVSYADWELIGRLRPGVSMEQARTELVSLLRESEQAGATPASGWKPEIEHLEENALQRLRQAGIFPALILVLLLIAGMNIACLRLVDNELRRHDTSIRTALGAGRLALAREHLAETILVAVSGTGLGLLASIWLIELAPALLYAGMGFSDYYIRFDWRTFAFACSALVIVCVMGALAPLKDFWRASVGSGLQVRSGFKSSPWLTAFVVAQMGFVTATTCSAALLWRSLNNISAIRPAMDPDRKLLILTGGCYEHSGAVRAARMEAMAERFQSLPGAVRVAYARRAMLSGSGGGAEIAIELQGQGKFSYRYDQVSDSYFATVGARLTRGRSFNRAGATPELMVNEAFVRRFFPSGEPVGRWVGLGGRDAQIIGVVEDGPTNNLKEEILPYLYLPFSQLPSADITFFIETARDPAMLADSARKLARSSDRAIVISGIETMRQHMSVERRHQEIAAAIGGSLAAVALLLAAAGLFGVTLHSVNRRTRDFGIRLALGAKPRDLHRQVLAEAARIVVVGLPLGWSLAWASRHIIERFLYGVHGSDIGTLCLASVVVILVAFTAALAPARRAAMVDVAVALRHD